jgi:hypothetical protein
VATFSPAFVRAYLFGALDPPNTGWHQAIGFDWGVVLTFRNFYPASSGRTVNIRYGVGTTPGTYATVVAPNDAGATLTQFFVQPSWYVSFEFINDGTFDGPTNMILANLSNNTSIITFSVEFAP